MAPSVANKLIATLMLIAGALMLAPPTRAEVAVIVNNAGFGLFGHSVELDRTEQLQMIDLNVRALTELAPRFGSPSARRIEVLRTHMARRDSLEATIRADGNQLEAYRQALPRFDAIHDSMVVELTGFRLPSSINEEYKAHYADIDLYGTFNFHKNVGAQPNVVVAEVLLAPDDADLSEASPVREHEAASI